MSNVARKISPVYVWRVNCAKRFSMSGDETLYGPDFSEDLPLRKKSNEDVEEESEKKE